MDLYYEIGYGLFNDTKMSPQLYSSPSFGVEIMKKREKLIFFFQMIKLCCKVVSINNFQPQSYSSKCLEGNREQISKSVHIYAFYIDFSTSSRYGAMFQALYVRKYCLGLYLGNSNLL